MIYLLVVLGVFAIDWKSKKYIEDNYELDEPNELVKDVADIQYTENKGAFLGTFEDKPEYVDRSMFAALGAIVTLFLYSLQQKRSKFVKTGFAFVLGGGIANVSERTKKGHVVDFLNIKCFKPLRNIVFNVADIFLVIGAIMVTIAELRRYKKNK